jgi:hypothetical protein
VADRLGEGLEEAERRGLDDRVDGGVDARVVDRLREVVVDAGGLEVDEELDVHLERLGRRQLLGLDPVPALEAHVMEHDPIAQGWPPRSGGASGRQDPRTTASAMRAARTLGRTSWTRTISTPAATPSTVVARVASTRWYAGRSRMRPSVYLRDAPSRIGWPR